MVVKKRSDVPEATTEDLYDDLVPIDVDAMPDDIGECHIRVYHLILGSATLDCNT